MVSFRACPQPLGKTLRTHIRAQHAHTHHHLTRSLQGVLVSPVSASRLTPIILTLILNAIIWMVLCPNPPLLILAVETLSIGTNVGPRCCLGIRCLRTNSVSGEHHSSVIHW